MLRFDVTEMAELALVRFSGSGSTPAVLESGVQNGRRWLLLEWIEGAPILDVRKPADRLPVHDYLLLTLRVTRAIRALPMIPSPDNARDELRSLTPSWDHLTNEMWRVRGAGTVETVERHWEPAGLRHGDVRLSNVILTPDGGVRLIDPLGRFGPAEDDVASFCADVVWFHLRWEASRTFSDHDAVDVHLWEKLTEHFLDSVLAVAQWLDRVRLYRWTALSLTEMAGLNMNFGESLDACKALAALAGSIERSAGAPRLVPPAGRNSPCGCGSGRKSKLCCAR